MQTKLEVHNIFFCPRRSKHNSQQPNSPIRLLPNFFSWLLLLLIVVGLIYTYHVAHWPFENAYAAKNQVVSVQLNPPAGSQMDALEFLGFVCLAGLWGSGKSFTRRIV
jgi:hypothetical protein